MADAVRETFGTEIELENNGGVRAPLVKGPITRTDIDHDGSVRQHDRDLPRSPAVELKEVLRQTHSRRLRNPLPVGERGPGRGASRGEPIDDDRVYRGSSNSYFAGFALTGIELQRIKRTRVDVLTDYIRSKGTVHPLYDGRRVVIRNQSASGRPVHERELDAGAPLERPADRRSWPWPRPGSRGPPT